MSGPEVLNFGCRLNAYEAEVMRTLAPDASGAIIVNTCAVTSEAERQARQAIRRARREHPSARIVVTGCAAQIAPANWLNMPEVDSVLGNQEKLDAGALKEALKPEGAALQVNDIQMARETAAHLIDGFDGRTRAFVEVQQGCDHRCTFCIIPYGRGPNRSVPLGVLVEQVRGLVAKGFREIVLTGVDVTAYGADLPGAPRLGQMIRRLLACVPELPRLRLSSLDVAEVDADLWRLIAEEERLMPHLHLSLQAGADLILKRMKRRHLRDQAIAFCREARALRPDLTFGADLIAGFPTETDAHFRQSLDLVEECGLTWLHVFPYSARQGTPAARMPQLPGPVRKERAARLRTAGDRAVAAYLASRIGREERVLIETPGRGRTEGFAEVRLDPALPEGAIVARTITGVADGHLLADAA
ncbi:MAG: tRNA (N(6)-L-threonylcarbamoyladenosine(37)-C(2))-methylthiotransferase MtaB [Alphaproteobacteria bacterium]|nr:tRNA (N(6)-L-threonylcarbamoyladenosine(37)-C(2))-methylthiotransferase MtaB [Alphaproteobacteria bacterium]